MTSQMAKKTTVFLDVAPKIDVFLSFSNKFFSIIFYKTIETLENKWIDTNVKVWYLVVNCFKLCILAV